MTPPTPRTILTALLAFLIAVVGSSAVVATEPATELAARRAGDVARFDELPPVLPGADSFRSHRDLLGVDLDSTAYNQVRTDYDETAGELGNAFVQRSDAETERSLLLAARQRELGALAAATARRDSFVTLLDEVNGAIGALAVEVFVNLDNTAVLETLEDPASANQLQRDRALTLAAVNSLVAERNAALENVERAEASRVIASNAIDDIDQRLGLADERIAVAVDTTKRLAPVLGEQRENVETERALAIVTDTDLTLVSLDAYYRAAETLSAFDPGCGVEWWAIAGISRVEGRHGTFGGSELDTDGTADPPIIGIALNGSNGTAFIGDSDGGLLDGDPAVDRAVGPMQFIPDTWRRFAADGNGDGEASPHNIYDAATAAAFYLCRSGRGLSSDEALRVAYFSYNRSEAYVASVLGHARDYQTKLALGDRSG